MILFIVRSKMVDIVKILSCLLFWDLKNTFAIS